MVAGQHEDGILEPRLATGFLEEATDGHIGIANALMDGQALFWIDLLIFLRNDVGMMRRGCKDCGHEGLLHLRHLGSIVLQEGLVPNSPHAIKVGIATKTCVFVVVLTTIILLEASATSKGLKAHRASLGTMEEGSLIALANQQRSDATDMIHGSRREEEGLNETWDAAQDRGHAINRLASIAIAMAERDALRNQGIDTRGIASITTILQCTIQGSYIFATETLDYQHHDILLGHGYRVVGNMNGSKD